MEKSVKSTVKIKEISLKRAFDKKTVILLLFALILFFFFLISENVTFFDIIDLILYRTNFLIITVGIGFTFLALLFDTIAWKILLGISSIYPSYLSVYRIQLSSFSYGLLIPSAGAVEVIMRVTLGKKEFINMTENRNATGGEVLSSVIVHKLCGIIAFIPISIFLVFAMFEYFNTMLGNIQGLEPLPEDFGFSFILIMTFIAGFIISFFILIAVSPNFVKRITSAILQRIANVPFMGAYIKDLDRSFEKAIDDFSTQFMFLSQNKFAASFALIFAFLSQIAHWISIYYILHSVQIPILIEQVAAVNFLSGTADLIPLGIPGMAGLKEITLKFFLQYGLGLNQHIAWLGSILVQLVKVYFLVIVGICVYIVGKTKVTVKDIKETDY